MFGNDRTFRADLTKILNKLFKKEPFTFSKFADGELKILKGSHINNRQFDYDPSTDLIAQNMLWDSYTYKHPTYYVGIGCPCCLGVDDYKWMKNKSTQDESNLTWANIFVNSNYAFYRENFISEFHNNELVLVCNHDAVIPDTLPVVKDFRVGHSAWKNDHHIIVDIKKYISNNNVKGKLFLFCAGPFGNILAHQLHSFSLHNTYLDIGSTIDPDIGLGTRRGYLKGAPTIYKVCSWT